MTELTVQFRYAERPQRSVCARFITGGNPAEWLDKLISWGAPLAEISLYPVSKSRQDNRCLGVLVRNRSDNLTAPANCQGYGCIANRLYLPAEAIPFPELNESDWRQLLSSGPTEYVWHPQAGLVAFEPHELLDIATLLKPQQPLHDPTDGLPRWGYAEPGIAFSNRIGSLRAELPLSAEAMLTDARGDIGTLAKDFGKFGTPWKARLLQALESIEALILLPATVITAWLRRILPSIPLSSPTWGMGYAPDANVDLAIALRAGILLAAAFFIIKGMVLHGIGTLLPMLFGLAMIWLMMALANAIFRPTAAANAARPSPSPPPTARNPTSGSPGGGMLQRYMANFIRWSAGLLDARRRELDRLMKMLKDDPDEGLKYAIPMGGELGRGMAMPGWQLFQHAVDFSLGGGRVGAADYWHLPADTQVQLLQRYRELAARELQLGRYRRAAYIFAQLLGDLNAAASALVSGRFYREAAVIYRDKLNRPLDAARCLEDGGLLQEAIPIYRQQGQLEKVGDLYRRLEDTAQAETAYREAVAKSLEKFDYLDASRLYRDKLESPDEALAALDVGWEKSDQARRCLTGTFELLTNLGRHGELIRRITGLREQESLSVERRLDSVEVLSRLATDSPHQPSRTLAADSVLVLAAKLLTAKKPPSQQVTEAVARLARQDKLLTRDCRRAGQERPWLKTKSVEKTAKIPPPKVAKGPRLIKSFELPRDVIWTSACETDRNFYVLGHRDDQVVIALGAWSDPTATVSAVYWEKAHRADSHVSLCHSATDRTLFVASSDGKWFEPREFRATDVNPDWEFAVTPRWMPEGVSGMAVAPNGTVFVFQLTQMQLSGYSHPQGQVSVETLLVPLLDEPLEPHAPCVMVAGEDFVSLAVGSLICESRPHHSTSIRNEEQPIRGLAITPHRSPLRLAITYGIGGRIFWESIDSGITAPFGDGLTDPHVTFLRDGRLVVYGPQNWVVYSTRDNVLKPLLDERCGQDEAAFALLRSGVASQMGLCTLDGFVHVYELP